MSHVGPYICFLLYRSSLASLKLLRTIVVPFSGGSKSAMAPFKPLLIALRVINLVLAIYAEFAVTSILIESNGNKIFLDSSLLARVGLASLAVIWTAVTFCWSTCFNGARVLAVPGMIGDIVAVIVYASVAILSRGAGAMNCSRLGGTLYIWSDSLGAWIDSEGAALSPASVVRYFDEGFVKRECSFGKSLFATSIAIW